MTGARTTITVQKYQSKPYDRIAGPALNEIHITEAFGGNLEGEGTVRCLQVLRDDKSASYVAIERFRGKVSGREGKNRAVI